MTLRVRLISILAASVAVSAGIVRFLSLDAPIQKWSLATAWVSFVLLVLTLLVGPVRILRGSRSPIHDAVRRDIGVSAGIIGLAHVALGLQVHLGGDLWRYFVPPPSPEQATVVFLAANYLGLLAAVVLIGLTAISTDSSLRRIGVPKWKLLQRSAYPAAALVAIHAVVYQIIERRRILFIGILALASIAVLATQLAGARRFRGNRRAKRAGETTQ